MRRGAMIALAGAVLLGAAAPAAPPDHPVQYIKVDELKGMLDRGARPDVIDVRTTGEYDEVHIRGARSMPLRSIPQRIAEIPKDRLVVFY